VFADRGDDLTGLSVAYGLVRQAIEVRHHARPPRVIWSDA
jgi:hypothetical protein